MLTSMKEFAVTCPCQTVFNLLASEAELKCLDAGQKIRIKATCPTCETSYRPEVWMEALGKIPGKAVSKGSVPEKRVRIDRLGPNVRIGSGK
ncbi:MAG: hypothetical protein H7222_04385 [Methylotenera sp.]|nr:hypothetical protein [Oligoflexia bacterium]